jgi:hypothetical protein
MPELHRHRAKPRQNLGIGQMFQIPRQKVIHGFTLCNSRLTRQCLQMQVIDMDTRSYLERMLEPVSRCLTPEAADRLIQLRADPQLQTRIDELADKCTEGDLTDEERAEYDTYVRAGNLIAILQAKARKSMVP